MVKLDAVNKKVTLDNGTEISFDKCLIATGKGSKSSINCKSDVHSVDISI